MITESNYIDLVGGRFGKTTPAQLATLFQSVEASEASDHLVVHFHGGLVSRAAAADAANGLLATYHDGRSYPVFFFWNSDLASVLSANLAEIAQEPIFQRLVLRVIQLALGKLREEPDARGGLLDLDPLVAMPKDLHGLEAYASQREPPTRPAADDLTPAQRGQVDRELQQDPVLRDQSRAIAAAVAPPAAGSRDAGPAVAAAPTRMSPQIVEEIAAEEAPGGDRGLGLLTVARYAGQVLLAVLRRYAAGRQHGLYTTVVEEVLRLLYVDSLAGVAWKLMKQDTADAFGGDGALHGGTAFLRGLAAWWKPGRRLTLVGHSTGAIYIGNLLRHADRVLPAEAKLDVIFLAPACTFAFLRECLPLFQRRVEHLRMFALTDEVERGYWEVPALYHGSLLYLVSGLCEEEVDMPIVGMQRYHGAAGPYDRPEVREVAAYLKDGCVWGAAPQPAGRASSALRHGAFDDDPLTRQSLQHILLHGY